ncbi:MAG: radical SAM family heme chaperone HemW [Bacteroidales bacterium]|nr:radical SAM family heme chaperone HemW [Bacteroidales bacterium]
MAGIYLHIPFCRQKCHYCNFFSIASTRMKPQLLEGLHRELRQRKDYIGNEEVRTIYFGGGTPSLLGDREIQGLIDDISKHYRIIATPEITLEANPDDIDEAWLTALKKTGVNRLSIGIQSFFDDDLHYLNRVHNAGQAENCIRLALNYGYDNLTVDLIYGIPGLTEDKWKHNLDKVFSYKIPHISAYALTVEPKTALHTLIRKGKMNPVVDEQQVRHFEILTKAMAGHGYKHYEISNFCKPGQYSKHNSLYWLGGNYLGLGPSAHSFNGESRQWNVASVGKYVKQTDFKDEVYEKETLSLHQRYNEYVMTSLRTSWGCNLQHIENAFGTEYRNICEKAALPYLNEGKLMFDQNTLYLTNSGKLFADGIAAEMFWEEA